MRLNFECELIRRNECQWSWGVSPRTHLSKSVLDALNGMAYADDTQVTSLTASKSWGESDMITVSIVSADATPDAPKPHQRTSKPTKGPRVHGTGNPGAWMKSICSRPSTATRLISKVLIKGMSHSATSLSFKKWDTLGLGQPRPRCGKSSARVLKKSD